MPRSSRQIHKSYLLETLVSHRKTTVCHMLGSTARKPCIGSTLSVTEAWAVWSDTTSVAQQEGVPVVRRMCKVPPHCMLMSITNPLRHVNTFSALSHDTPPRARPERVPVLHKQMFACKNLYFYNFQPILYSPVINLHDISTNLYAPYILVLLIYVKGLSFSTSTNKDRCYESTCNK